MVGNAKSLSDLEMGVVGFCRGGFEDYLADGRMIDIKEGEKSTVYDEERVCEFLRHKTKLK